MKPTESFLGQPIRSLQTMLRVLAENDDEYKVLIPDGIYGPDTCRLRGLRTWKPGIGLWRNMPSPWWRSCSHRF